MGKVVPEAMLPLTPAVYHILLALADEDREPGRVARKAARLDRTGLIDLQDAARGEGRRRVQRPNERERARAESAKGRGSAEGGAHRSILRSDGRSTRRLLR